LDGIIRAVSKNFAHIVVRSRMACIPPAIRHVNRVDTMFTLEQINEIHDRLGKGESFAQYVEALNAIGVETYDSGILHAKFGGHVLCWWYDTTSTDHHQRAGQ